MTGSPSTLLTAAIDPATLPDVMDVLIVGGGPAGTAAAFRAKELGLSVLVIDFDDVLKRIRDYPKDKLILPDFGGGDRMSFPLAGDCIGSLHFEPIDKDDMCHAWKRRYVDFGVPVLVGVELTGLEADGDVWTAVTWNHGKREAAMFRARHVVLALGRGVPRRFDIPGNTDGIAYRMDDPANYVTGPACVIGGGTSAAEAVIAISRAKSESGDEAQVFWSYRGSRMPRVSKALADEFFEAYVGIGNIRYQPNSEPVAVVTSPDRSEFVSLRVDRRTADSRPPETIHYEFPKTQIIACIGEDIPESLLRDLGVHMAAVGDKSKKMCVVTPLLETQQRNVYLIGDLLSQAYLETDDFGAPTDAFRQVKHRGNIKSSLRDGVFVAEVIRQRLDGRARIEVVIRDASPAAAPSDAGVARVTAALGLSPETGEMAADPSVEEATAPGAAWLVSLTPTGIEAETFTLRNAATTTIGRMSSDLNFPEDAALSESHAAITLRDGECYLRDEGSRSGTWLRIRPDTPLGVQPGALLRAGRQILVVGQDESGLRLDQYDTRGQASRRHPLRSQAIVFGRHGGPSNPDVSLDDRDMTLSRFHMSASVMGGVVVIQDFGSRNGTYLKVDAERRIDHNDVIRIGAQQLQLRLYEELPEKTGSLPVAAFRPAAGAPPQVSQPRPASAPAPADAVSPPATATAGLQPHITFRDQGKSGTPEPDETLLSWADGHDVEIDNECWIGMCGCDVVRVIEGAEHLSAPDEKELKTLKRKGCDPTTHRLACMARCSGPVVVEVAQL